MTTLIHKISTYSQETTEKPTHKTQLSFTEIGNIRALLLQYGKVPMHEEVGNIDLLFVDRKGYEVVVDACMPQKQIAGLPKGLT